MDKNKDVTPIKSKVQSEPILAEGKTGDDKIDRRVSFDLNHRYLEPINPWESRKGEFVEPSKRNFFLLLLD